MSRGRTYDGAIGNGVGLAPARHDEGVVVGEEDDLVNALGLELVLVLDVRRQVGSGAGGGEGAGDSDYDDLLVGELCCETSLVPRSSRCGWQRMGMGRRTSRGVVVLGDTADLEALDLGREGDVGEGDPLRESVSGLELRHGGDLKCCCLEDSRVCVRLGCLVMEGKEEDGKETARKCLGAFYLRMSQTLVRQGEVGSFGLAPAPT